MQNKYLFILLVLALILRTLSLNESLWLDEATSVKAASFTFQEIIGKFSPGDFHPPLYYLLLKTWISFFGNSEISIRLMSVLFGVFSVWLVTKLTYQVFKNNKIAIFSGLLLTISPLHIYYSQEARMYSMSVFLSLAVTYLFYKAFFEKTNIVSKFLFVVASVTLLYTNYLSSVILLACGVCMFLFNRRKLSEFLVFVLITIFFFVPWFPTFLHQLGVANDARANASTWINSLGKTSMKEIALVPIKFIIGRISFFDKTIYGLYVFIAGLIYIFPITQSLKKISNTKIIWIFVLAPFISTLALGYVSSGFSYFRLIFILPFFIILVVYGTLSIKNTIYKKFIISGIILLSLISNSIYLLNSSLHREDWRGAKQHIERNSENKSAIVLFVTDNQQDAYNYYQGKIISSGPSGLDNSFDTIWLVRYVQPIFDPEDNLRKKVESQGYKKISEDDFNGVVVWQYEKETLEYAHRN